MTAALRPLLDYLHQTRPASQNWQGWSVRRVDGGGNNLLYHASGSAGDFAVKFTVPDDRDRAGREYAALRALGEAGLRVAPEAVLLDRDSYDLPRRRADMARG